MDLGLSAQQSAILRRARARSLKRAAHWQIQPPLWLLALVTLAPLLLVSHPGRYLWLLLVPALGLWQRRRMELRFQEWILDLRES